MRRFYRSIFSIGCLTFLCFSSVSGYFEEQFFCVVDDTSIEVSLYTGDASCFSYIAQIAGSIASTTVEISRADAYIDQGRDATYRSQVGDELRARLYALEQLRSQMIIAVDDYEFELFLKVKSLVAWHMMPRRQQVMNKITTADKLLAQLKKVGNIQQYTFVVRQAEKLQQQLILYDRIREASSFGQLIPPLKLYFQGGGFELDTTNIPGTTTDIT